MPVHLLHISKTGGSAIKYAFRRLATEHDDPRVRTPYGQVKVHGHPFRMEKLRPGPRQVAVFVVRDPVARFTSGFYSRLRQGRPKYNAPWSESETVAFEQFPTPQALAAALAPDHPDHEQAVFAVEHINHLRWHQVRWTGTVDQLREWMPRVLYVGRQETLDADWACLKELLDLPDAAELPTEEKAAHRGGSDEDRTLTADAEQAVRGWYAEDCRMVDYCEELRQEGVFTPERLAPFYTARRSA